MSDNRPSSMWPSSPTLSFNCDEEPLVSDEQLTTFLSTWTGQHDDLQLLREHVISIWSKVRQEAHVFRCVQRFGFLRPRSSTHPSIRILLDRVSLSREGFVADLGCCFGQDIRSLLLSGIPASRLLAVDLHDVYWRHGEELFDAPSISSRSAAGVATCFGDWSTPLATPDGGPDDISLPYKERLAGVLQMFVLHTLSSEQSRNMLRRVLFCLESGGVLIGACVGCRVKEGSSWRLTPDGKQPRFLHSVETLTALLQDIGFENVAVEEWTRSHEESDDGVRRSSSSSEMPADAIPHTTLSFSARKPL